MSPKSFEKPSQEDIAKGLREGSSEAFRALYQAYGQAVLIYLTRMIGRKEMAEEVTQETFLTTIRKISFFRSEFDGGLKAWVFRIATNLAIDALRRGKRVILDQSNAADSEMDVRPGAHDELERFEFSAALSRALLELVPMQRMVFLLKEQEEMSLLEISRICGVNENAIKQSLFRARAALRKKLCE